MFDYKLKIVDKKIRRLYRRRCLQGKKIYLFGVSENTRQIIQILRSCHLEPINVLDNDEKRQDTFCKGVHVISVEDVEDIQDEQNIYILYSAYWKEMTAQLRSKGVRKQNIQMLYREEKLLECFKFAYIGKRIYENLIDKYGEVPVFVCPYTGTGDIYLIGTFWEQYIEKNQIEDYVFLVLSKACEKVARLFKIKNVEIFEKKVESCYLIQYYMLRPNKVNLKILNDSWAQIHTNPLEWFRGYKGLNFTELFRDFVFGLPDTARPKHPVFDDMEQELQPLFEEYHLESGNTVVLSPYSNTLEDLPKEFWTSLADRLKEAGFKVCTNSNGDTEPAVEGTVPVFFPLDMAPQWIEKAGYFIGVRSGFCDVVSGAKAKKIVLYGSQDRFFNGSAFEYFSLKSMGLSEDVVEILFERGDECLTEKVIDCLY